LDDYADYSSLLYGVGFPGAYAIIKAGCYCSNEVEWVESNRLSREGVAITKADKNQLASNKQKENAVDALIEVCESQTKEIQELQRKCRSLENCIKDLKRNISYFLEKEAVSTPISRHVHSVPSTVTDTSDSCTLTRTESDTVASTVCNVGSVGSGSDTDVPEIDKLSPDSLTEQELQDKPQMPFKLPNNTKHLIIGDSNLQHLVTRRMSLDGSTQIRTFRGATIGDMIDVLSSSTPTENITKCILHVGTNNITTSLTKEEMSRIITQYDELLSTAQIIMPAAEIAVSAIPPQRPWMKSPICAAFNARLQSLCADRKVLFLSHIQLWQRDLHNRLDPLILRDKVHLSNKGLGLLLRDVKSFLFRSPEEASPNGAKDEVGRTMMRGHAQAQTGANCNETFAAVTARMPNPGLSKTSDASQYLHPDDRTPLSSTVHPSRPTENIQLLQSVMDSRQPEVETTGRGRDDLPGHYLPDTVLHEPPSFHPDTSAFSLQPPIEFESPSMSSLMNTNPSLSVPFLAYGNPTPLHFQVHSLQPSSMKYCVPFQHQDQTIPQATCPQLLPTMPYLPHIQYQMHQPLMSMQHMLPSALHQCIHEGQFQTLSHPLAPHIPPQLTQPPYPGYWGNQLYV